jgi:hypothetical protein
MSLNGIPIFPLEVSGDKPLVASQMPHEVDTIVYMVDREKFPQVTLDNSRLITTDFITEDGAREYTLELSVFAVDGTPVKLEGVQMIVVESPTGELTFGPVRPIPKNETCGASVKCMIAKMMDRIRHMGWGGRKGGCKGRKGGKHGHGHGNPVAEGLEGLDMDLPRPPHHAGDDDLPPPPHHHHHHHGPHHHHHGPHHRGGIFHRIMGQVLLPIFVGIVAGMTVAAIGVIVGHCAVLFWYRLRGIKRERCCKKKGGRRGFFGRRRKHEHEPETEAEKGLLQEQEEEQQQEEPPAYVDDAPEVVVVEKE